MVDEGFHEVDDDINCLDGYIFQSDEIHYYLIISSYDDI